MEFVRRLHYQLGSTQICCLYLSGDYTISSTVKAVYCCQYLSGDYTGNLSHHLSGHYTIRCSEDGIHEAWFPGGTAAVVGADGCGVPGKRQKQIHVHHDVQVHAGRVNNDNDNGTLVMTVTVTMTSWL